MCTDDIEHLYMEVTMRIEGAGMIKVRKRVVLNRKQVEKKSEVLLCKITFLAITAYHELKRRLNQTSIEIGNEISQKD